MNCLKCGKETAENRAFCDGCLGVMSDYPIKVDAKVTLPHQEAFVAPKKQPKKRTPEELLDSAHRLVRRLIIALVTVTILFVLSASALVHLYLEGETLPTIGRNYTVDTTQQTQPSN